MGLKLLKAPQRGHLIDTDPQIAPSSILSNKRRHLSQRSSLFSKANRSKRGPPRQGWGRP